MTAEAAPMRERAGGPRRERLSSVLSTLLVGSGFVPVWLATVVLLLVAVAIAPETLSSESLSSAVLPFMAFLAIAALGEMLVIMTGGIDLSIPGVIVLVAHVVVGASGGENNRLAFAIFVCLALAALVGLVNGLLVGVALLNPLIVTLAVGQIVTGITVGYARSIANESAVPTALSNWATRQYFGITPIFWLGIAVTIVLALFLRNTAAGRRFQLSGANPRAAWIAGINVRRHVVLAYTAAGALYGTVGVLLAGLIRSPSIDLGDPYFLGPIAVVVIAGASLAGGLASATSTWVAAFAITLLSQMLRVLGLSSALQFAIYGAAIAAGMVISGDRIVGVLGGLSQLSQARSSAGPGGDDGAESEEERRDLTG